jgi:hypothetical protein
MPGASEGIQHFFPEPLLEDIAGDVVGPHIPRTRLEELVETLLERRWAVAKPIPERSASTNHPCGEVLASVLLEIAFF